MCLWVWGRVILVSTMNEICVLEAQLIKLRVRNWVQPEDPKSKTASHWLLPHPQSEMVTLPLGISE